MNFGNTSQGANVFAVSLSGGAETFDITTYQFQIHGERFYAFVDVHPSGSLF